MSDNEVLAALYREAHDDASPLNLEARRIVKREHYRVIYQRYPEDMKRNPAAAAAVYVAAAQEFGEENVS